MGGLLGGSAMLSATSRASGVCELRGGAPCLFVPQARVHEELPTDMLVGHYCWAVPSLSHGHQGGGRAGLARFGPVGHHKAMAL
jgi:hypothetical protein